MIYAGLPVLINDFTYPPGDDPLRLEHSLYRAGWIYRYYGHFPAYFLGMTLYYYSTPVFIYGGLWFLLGRYGQWLPLAAWVSLFLINRTVLFDLFAGSFVGLISFYFAGFGILRLHARWIERRSGLGVAFLAPLLILFHSFTGLVTMLGLTGYALLARRPKLIYVSGLMLATAMVSAWVFGSSIARIGIVPSLSDPFAEAFVEYDRMPYDRFIAEYLGLGSILIITAGLLLGLQAFARGWRPKHDLAIFSLGIMVIPLSIATFTDLALNADRTAKLLVGVCLVLSLYVIWETVPFFRRRFLGVSISYVFLTALAVSAPQVFPYWLSLGSYR